MNRWMDGNRQERFLVTGSEFKWEFILPTSYWPEPMLCDRTCTNGSSCYANLPVGLPALIVTPPPLCQAGFSNQGSRQLEQNGCSPHTDNGFFGDSRCARAFILQASVDREHLSKLSKKRNWKEETVNNWQGGVFLWRRMSWWYSSVGNDGQRPHKDIFILSPFFFFF